MEGGCLSILFRLTKVVSVEKFSRLVKISFLPILFRPCLAGFTAATFEAFFSLVESGMRVCLSVHMGSLSSIEISLAQCLLS
jgi:hypothetical protein